MELQTSVKAPSLRLEADALTRAAQPERVCQAWHRTSEVKVLAPGDRGAEGEEKGKGVTARWGPEERNLSTRMRQSGLEFSE